MIKTKDVEVARPFDCPFRMESEIADYIFKMVCHAPKDRQMPYRIIQCPNTDEFPEDCPLDKQNFNVWRSK